MRKNTITIIIVTFNSEKYIEDCLNSVLRSTSSSFQIKIIVIDNNSNDTTVSKVKKLKEIDSRIFIIENSKNLGFARAINQVLSSENKTDYYLLLNPDTVSKKETIKNLIQCAEKNGAGIIGGSTYDNNGVQNGSYFRIPNIFVGIFDFTNFRKLFKNEYWHNYFYYIDLVQTNSSCFPVDVVTGGFMLLSIEAVRKIGLLDERFFMYLEDVDYCLRAKKAGIKVFHTNNAKVIHFAGRSSANRDRIRHSSWLWSRKLYYFKNANILENIIIQPIFIIDDLFILMKLFLKK